ncbi:hypothetical protein CPB83DRAFT_838785 [Crepidotus variabilis]|uniref:Uncharacterized protein n=1 Tax=Crepidotus variabilis TaxID=179855 RepID=A0A9P6JKZ3_9AGAR|nr:hypothetical protein CPB83DRAFT_838785 [Crepidotus variabilis]
MAEFTAVLDPIEYPAFSNPTIIRTSPHRFEVVPVNDAKDEIIHAVFTPQMLCSYVTYSSRAAAAVLDLQLSTQMDRDGPPFGYTKLVSYFNRLAPPECPKLTVFDHATNSFVAPDTLITPAYFGLRDSSLPKFKKVKEASPSITESPTPKPAYTSSQKKTCSSSLGNGVSYGRPHLKYRERSLFAALHSARRDGGTNGLVADLLFSASSQHATQQLATTRHFARRKGNHNSKRNHAQKKRPSGTSKSSAKAPSDDINIVMNNAGLNVSSSGSTSA